MSDSDGDVVELHQVLANAEIAAALGTTSQIFASFAIREGSLYDSLDERNRLIYAIERMNVNNMSPIHGVADVANDMGFRECLQYATVREHHR